MRKIVTVTSLLLLICLLTIPAMAKTKINIVVVDAPGVGFNDPTPAAPVGGNPGTTVGQQRLIAFTFAANIWGSTLDSAADINIQASFPALACTATTATLGSAGTIQIVFNFPGEEFPNTLYHTALANKLALQDLIPGAPGTNADDIRARFNGNLGNPGCLTGTTWYYGLDTNHASTQINLVTVLLHEFGHGLGFSTFTSGTSGAFLAGFPSIWDRYIFDTTFNKTWFDMTDAERRASAINPRHVAWIGSHVTEEVPGVLALGVPGLQITSPLALSGHYEVGAAAFGNQLTPSGIAGDIVVATDAVNTLGPSATDACTAITNASAIAGKIALVDRGTCGFVVKVKNAQDAGAIAVLVADNVAGGPPAGLGGADPTITIPSVRITLPDGNAIKAALGSGPVSGSLLLDMSRRAGTDGADHALLYTPNPFISGSSVSHYDQQEFPNQLMEPNINLDLTLSVKPPQDLTLPLMRDIGWYPDEDVDGVPDASDQCLGSDLTQGTIVLQGCNTTVNNQLFTTGCTIRDLIKNAGTGVSNHGGFVSNMAHLGDALVNAGVITGDQKDKLQSCAARAK